MVVLARRLGVRRTGIYVVLAVALSASVMAEASAHDTAAQPPAATSDAKAAYLARLAAYDAARQQFEVLAQPYWWDEQWTISVQHTAADIDKHLEVFEEIAPALAEAQRERGVAFVGAAGH